MMSIARHNKKSHGLLPLLIVLLAACLCPARQVFALTAADLDPARHYYVASIAFSGNSAFSDEELLGVMATKQRPFYKVWQRRPDFEPETLTEDLDRLARFYRFHGYYKARIKYDLKVRGDLVSVKIQVAENAPVKVEAVDIDIDGHGPSPQSLEPSIKLPLRVGEIFDEGEYELTQQVLSEVYLRNGYAHAQAHRKAKVFLASDRARVRYTISPGPVAAFGTTRVTGTREVNPRIVLRQLTYRRGERFSAAKIEASRSDILKLNLFNSVEFNTEPNKDRSIVPIQVKVQEKPPRNLNVGIGYNTQTLFNARLQWQHYNWLGDGRQLTLSATYSGVASSLDAKLVQPYLFTPKLRLIVEATQGQDVYQTYTLNASRLTPHLDYTFSPKLSAFLGYRLEYLKFNAVDPSTAAAIGGFRRQGILSGPYLGMVFNNTDNPFSPNRGEVVSFNASQAGEIFNGDYRYYRITAQARKYFALGWRTVLAGRFKIGIADSLGTIRDIPLSERFYSGGEGSVRGYGLRRIGPLSEANDPLGGLSLVEGSVELRRPLFWKLSGALFFDFGQVSTHAYDLPFDSLVFGYGPALGIETPVGPLRVDLGIPSSAPRGDSSWQLYFSIGQFY